MIIHEKGGIELEINPRGKRMEISISKIKNTIAIKKNRIEKGIREEFFGSNPHSKGDAFSRSKIVFFENNVDNKINKELIRTAIIKEINISLIA